MVELNFSQQEALVGSRKNIYPPKLVSIEYFMARFNDQRFNAETSDYFQGIRMRNLVFEFVADARETKPLSPKIRMRARRSGVRAK